MAPSLKRPIRGPLIFKGPLTDGRAPVSKRAQIFRIAPAYQRAPDSWEDT